METAFNGDSVQWRQRSSRHRWIRDHAKMLLHRVHHIRFRAHVSHPREYTHHAVSSLKTAVLDGLVFQNPLSRITQYLVDSF